MRGVWLNLDKSSILNPIFASCSNLNFIYNALIMIMLVLVHMKSKIFDNVLYDIWSNWEKPDAPENSFTALSIKAKKCMSLRCSYQWVQKMSPLHSFNTSTRVQNTFLDARLNVLSVVQFHRSYTTITNSQIPNVSAFSRKNKTILETKRKC